MSVDAAFNSLFYRKYGAKGLVSASLVKGGALIPKRSSEVDEGSLPGKLVR